MANKKQEVKTDRKNYSFYMPVEFDNALVELQKRDTRLKPLSKSQAVNFIICEIETTGKFVLNSSK